MVQRIVLAMGFIASLLLTGCSGGGSHAGFSYAPTDSDKSMNYSYSYRVSGKTTEKKQDVKPQHSLPERKVKHKIKTGSFDRVGPILNKLTARNAINSYRKSLGLRPLKLNRHLENAAYLHSIEMARVDKVFHVGPQGTDPWDRVVARGYTPEMATQNIGAGQSDFNTLLRLWRESKHHNANLLIPDATDMGIALIHDKGTNLKTFWTLVIAKRKH